MAGPTISFETNADDNRVARVLGDARGFIFPAEEDFGIVQVEALSAGTPVIGLGRGGTLDIIDNGKGGVLFNEQTVESIVDAIVKAEQTEFKPEDLQRIAKRFHKTLFISKIQKIVGDHVKA
jgi:glycosyltransferase involved in cell wall biosynthesis